MDDLKLLRSGAKGQGEGSKDFSRSPFPFSLSPGDALHDERYPVPLRDRIEHLPLLLAGPILRRTESDAVTVWVALKAPREVTLKVYGTDDNGSILKTLLLEGSRSTVPLGKHLHVVAVTARAINSYRLEPGQIYAYDLSFGSHEQNLAQALTAQLFPHVTVSYFEHQLPTFAMPPEDLNDLRLAHGSCRKLHGSGRDALPLLDDLIGHYAKEPNSRLHQLFFTGDQIYGDDVANPLLWAATETGDTLLGWEENLPFYQTPTNGYKYKKPSELKPGQRTDIARDYGGFTAMLLDTPEEAKSHLFSLGEYFAAYLLVWSPILWPEYLPKGKDIHKDRKQARVWNEEAPHVQECISQLWKVRRAMANVPTYMIFDDHDISDDWYLNRAWCISVLGKPLGRRAVHNGMLAYAVFQAWGNTPDQFEEGKPGGNLLQAATRWSASAGTDESASEEIAKLLGIPQLEPETGLPKFRPDGDVLILDREYPDGTLPVEWHYSVRSHKHEVIVLDTRTWRGYPQADGEMGIWADGEIRRTPNPKSKTRPQDVSAAGRSPVRGRQNPKSISLTASSAIAPPMLLCPTAFKQQLEKPLELSDRLKQADKSDIELTFVILPTNLVSLRIIDVVQRLELDRGNVFNSDVGDAWNMNEVALSRLLTELFQRRRVVVVLTGDIHYAGTVRLSYWLNPRQEGTGDWGQGEAKTRRRGHAETLRPGEGFVENAGNISPPSPPSPYSSQSPIPNSQSPIPIAPNPHRSFSEEGPRVPQSPIPTNARVLAQLTASAFKNGEFKTHFVHTKAKSLAPEPSQDWAGWNNPPQLVEIQITPEKVRMLDVEVPATGPVVRQITGARGNWNIAWEIAIKDRSSLPDWQYHIEWIKREKASLAPWIGKQASSAPSNNKNSTGWLAAAGNLVSKLWRNQWLQEGEEVVGRNNFGVVSLKWSQNDEAAKAVIQDSYWRPPWQPNSVVYSRYFVSLHVDNPPPPPKIISTIVSTR
jgi:hypothetical protein